MIFIDHEEGLEGKITVVKIKGVLNSDTTIDFEEYINQLLAKRKYFIILDAENLGYISSAGIGVILYIQKKILAGKGFFIVCNISEEISTLYEILGFDKIIKITSGRDEALSLMKTQLELIESRVEENPLEKEPDILSAKIEHKTIDSVKSEEDRLFENPIILECAECKGLIRVKKSGLYICPDCKSEFSVEADQTVVF